MPKEEDALAFNDFRTNLELSSGKDVIVVPGNHDQKYFGNVPASMKELAKLEWSNLVIDDELECAFLCFDSSRDADLAKGKITDEQKIAVATAFEKKAALKPALNNYLRIALTHHHPFTFKTEAETKVQRFLGRLGLEEETFLSMEDGEGFIDWCAKRGVSTVLHGHKHVQRYVEKRVSIHGTRKYPTRRTVTSVGCGTSTGAEGLPLSYNVLSWDSYSKSWAVTFFADPGDGSGFARQYVALNKIQSEDDY